MTLFGMRLLMGASNPPKIAYFLGLSPLIVIGILVYVWLLLERHRQFYPYVAFLLVLGWVTFLIAAEKWSEWTLIASYALWHLWLMKWFDFLLAHAS